MLIACGIQRRSLLEGTHYRVRQYTQCQYFDSPGQILLSHEWKLLCQMRMLKELENFRLFSKQLKDFPELKKKKKKKKKKHYKLTTS